MIPEKGNLTQELLDKLPIQFYNKNNVIALLTTYGSSLQDTNDEIFDIVNNVNIEDATGYLLDCVGSYVAVLRNKDDDETFRARIKRKILAASSGGTPNELLEALAFVTQGEAHIWEHFPVASHFSTTGTLIPKNLHQFIQDASPATSGHVVIYLNPFENCFIPSELGFDVLKLADKNLDEFVTHLNDNIVVNNLIYGGAETLFAELSEFTYGQGSGSEKNYVDGKGIPCEIVYYSGGVNTYDHDYITLDTTINQWYFLMNYKVPEDFN